jgi:hypothetical protein
MPGGGGGGGTVATTQNQNTNSNGWSTVNNNGSNWGSVNTGPWAPQQPYLQSAFSGASDALSKGLQYYPGQTVAGFNPTQNSAFSAITNQASSPLFPTAQAQDLKTINGDYLDPTTNPWLTSTYNAAADAVGRTFQNVTAPTTDAMYASQGPLSGGARFNSQYNNNMGLGTTLNNLATQIYGGNYQTERQNQTSATQGVGSMIQAGYIDPSMLLGVGNQQQQQQQNQINADMAKWNFNQMAPWQTLAQYMGIIGGNYGQSGTTSGGSSGLQNTQGVQNGSMQGWGTVPYSSNPVGSALGGVLGLGSLAGQLGWSPFSAAAGAAGAGATPLTMAGAQAGAAALGLV